MVWHFMSLIEQNMKWLTANLYNFETDIVEIQWSLNRESEYLIENLHVAFNAFFCIVSNSLIKVLIAEPQIPTQ